VVVVPPSRFSHLLGLRTPREQSWVADVDLPWRPVRPRVCSFQHPLEPTSETRF
jgi:hypothetical protein